MNSTEEKDLRMKVLEKAWADSDFRERLVAQPVETLKEFSGGTFKMLNGKKLVIRDQTDESKVFLNIPREEALATDKELTDEQLEYVAGGGIRELGEATGEWVRSWGDDDAFWS